MLRTKIFRGMKCRKVGHSGLWASEVGLGLWKWGDPSYDKSRVGDHEGFKILDRALELGVFYWDTANSYNWGSGNSERLLGRYFASRPRWVRDQVVLATKIRNPVREEHVEKMEFTPNQMGASRIYVKKAVEDCLRRLKSDYIDILYLHAPVLFDDGTYETSLEETWGAMDDLIIQGKVQYLGVSGHTSDQIQDILDVQDKFVKDGSRKLTAAMNCYNILERDRVSGKEEQSLPGDEKRFLDFCREKKIGVVPFMPLASGMLTGRYKKESLDAVKGKLIDDYEQYGHRYFTDYNFRVVELLGEIAKEKEISMSQLAIAWLLSHEEVSTVITGVTRMEQLEDNAKATNVQLTQKDAEKIEEILGRAKT